MNSEEIIDLITNRGSELLLGLAAAIVILLVGRVASRWAAKLTKRIVASRFEDPSLARFASSLVNVVVLVFFVIAAISKVGIQTTSFIAVIGAAGLAVGMALQGSLANFASGVLLLVFRPLAVGEFVEAGGETGKVEEIGIFTTTLVTPDNKTVIIANSGVTGNNITNYSRKPTRRVDLVFGIDYGDDIRRAKEILLEEMDANGLVLADPAPFVAVGALADSAVELVARAWTRNESYWDVHFGLTESVKHRFDAAGISFPFPQRDVHIHKGAEA